MTRRHRKPPKPKQIDGALIVVAPGAGVVERTSQAVGDARKLAEAKRAVERALRAAGLSERQSRITVAAMAHDDLLAEAARVQASDPVQVPEPCARPWWRRLFGGRQ